MVSTIKHTLVGIGNHMISSALLEIHNNYVIACTEPCESVVVALSHVKV